MPTTYAYKVRDRSGRCSPASLDADNTALVANKLRQMGYVPIAIDKKAGAGGQPGDRHPRAAATGSS